VSSCEPQARLNVMTEERSKFIARVFLGISLSVLLHVLVSVATYEFSEMFSAPKARPAALIEWIEPSDLKKDDWTNRENQVVRKADLPPDALDLNVKANRRFLSEEKQTVKQETRAAASGMTENRAPETLDLKPSRPASQAQTQGAKNSSGDVAQGARAPRERQPEVVPNSIFEEGLGDISVKRELQASNQARRGQPESRELLLPSDPRRNRGVSTTGEQLPKDIQIGDFTALNTDRFVYYTFYARIEEQIRHRWVRYVKAAIFGGGDIPSGKNDFNTNIEIVLNREGDFVRAILHQGSGSKDLDAAPILAFREAKRIPHPPREMVKDDGTIRLYYAFHVDQLPPLARGQGRTAEQEGVQ